MGNWYVNFLMIYDLLFSEYSTKQTEQWMRAAPTHRFHPKANVDLLRVQSTSYVPTQCDFSLAYCPEYTHSTTI